eukprot:365032-Chlamydomonas_euryale.AAC.23
MDEWRAGRATQSFFVRNVLVHRSINPQMQNMRDQTGNTQRTSWKDRWTDDGWTDDGWTDGQMTDGQMTDGQMTDGQMDGHMGGWTNGWTDR